MIVVMTSFIPVIPVMCHPAISCMPVGARSPAQIDHIDEHFPSLLLTGKIDSVVRVLAGWEERNVQLSERTDSSLDCDLYLQV